MAGEAAPGKAQHQAGGPAALHRGSRAPSVQNGPDVGLPAFPASSHSASVCCGPEHLLGVERRIQKLLSLEALLSPKGQSLGPSNRDSANEAEGLSGVSWC